MMFQKLRIDLTRKLKPVKLLVVNADIFLAESRTRYLQAPSLNNGHEVNVLKKLGVESVAISPRRSEALYSITGRLGIGLIYQDISQKLYSKIRAEHSVSDNEIAFISGDLSDLHIIKKVNFPVAPADAPLEVKAKSYYVTYGIGEEAVREVAELILKAKGRLL